MKFRASESKIKIAKCQARIQELVMGGAVAGSGGEAPSLRRQGGLGASQRSATFTIFQQK